MKKTKGGQLTQAGWESYCSGCDCRKLSGWPLFREHENPWFFQ